MDSLDIRILHFFNQFAQKSQTFDNAVYLLSETALFKGVVIILIFWWFWFKDSKNHSNNRKIILSSLLGSGLAIALSRSLTFILPFRIRPLNNPNFKFVPPYSVDAGISESLSSFPSDHATVFFMLAASIVFLSKRVGYILLAYVLIFICIPTIYLGDHFPTDVLGGAALGATIAVFFNATAVKNFISVPLMRWLEKSPPIFYTCFFLFSYLLATNFTDIRSIIKYIINSRF